MPLFKGSEPLANYLVAQSIRYVAFSYGKEPYVQLARGVPFDFPWFRATYLQTIDFEDNLAELGRTRIRLFDDGKNFVLDLLQPHAAGGH